MVGVVGGCMGAAGRPQEGAKRSAEIVQAREWFAERLRSTGRLVGEVGRRAAGTSLASCHLFPDGQTGYGGGQTAS